MNFERLLQCLVMEVNRRVRNGEWTERQLARRSGISQPHIHNVLKGARTLTPDVADQLMSVMGIPMEKVIDAATISRRIPQSAFFHSSQTAGQQAG
jgi:transcriptional regulator with XRE-family HTH domain